MNTCVYIHIYIYTHIIHTCICTTLYYDRLQSNVNLVDIEVSGKQILDSIHNQYGNHAIPRACLQ